MNTNHTPGPWKYCEDSQLIETAMPNLRDEHLHICDFRPPVNDADARLIAAAPEMLAALERICNGGNVDKGAHMQVDIEDIGVALTALAKAKGLL